MVTLNIDRVNNYITLSNPEQCGRGNYNRTKHRWYKHRTKKAEMKIKRYAAALFDLSKKQKLPVLMLTITTKQHETGLDDKHYTNVLRDWFKNNKDYFEHYISVCERQPKKTNDIHFHILLIAKKHIPIQKTILYFSRRFNIAYHPAILDISRVSKKAAPYIAKYMSKDRSSPANDIFTCRSWSSARKLTKYYKENANKYQLKLDNANDLIDSYKHLFVYKKVLEYAVIVKYNVQIWHMLKMLKKQSKDISVDSVSLPVKSVAFDLENSKN